MIIFNSQNLGTDTIRIIFVQNPIFLQGIKEFVSLWDFFLEKFNF